MSYKELKTYEVVCKNYFWNNYDLEQFMEQVELEYSGLIKSDKTLKILLRDLDRVKYKTLCKAEKLFKEIVQEDFTFIENFLNAIYRIYVNKLDSRLFRLYKNKETKEFYFYDITYKDNEIKNISSLDVIQMCKEHFNLDFGNLGTAGIFVNNLIKNSNKLRLRRKK